MRHARSHADLLVEILTSAFFMGSFHRRRTGLKISFAFSELLINNCLTIPQKMDVPNSCQDFHPTVHNWLIKFPQF